MEEYAESVYVMGEKSKELAAEPLWLPSFIDAEIWKQAVSKFRRFKRLDRSVEEYLLPEMGEYLENIPNAELVSITRDFLIEQGVINSPISQRGGDTYYFDENEVYSLDKNSERFLYEKRIKFHLFKIEFETCFDMRVWRKAVSQFETGMTLTECIGIFLETKLVCGGQQDISPVDQLVQYEVSTTWVLPPEPCGHLSMHTALRTVIILRLHRIVNFCITGWTNGQSLAVPFAHKGFPLVLPCKVFQPLYLVHD